MITYKADDAWITIVYLERKRVGLIVSLEPGYQYQPDWSELKGETFLTIEECKQSIEKEIKK